MAKRFTPSEVADQVKEAQALRADGLSLADIAGQMGLGVSTVHNRVRAKVKVETQEEVDRKAEIKTMVVHELEKSVVRCSEMEEAATTPREVTEAIQGKARAISELAKLLGLYAPKAVRDDVVEEEVGGKVIPMDNSKYKTAVRM